MSSAGVHATILDAGLDAGPALMIGAKVPRLHHSDGMPVYLVVPHPDGALIGLRGGNVMNLLAYPSHWPGPGKRTPDRVIYASHERLAWNAPIPCFDTEEDPHAEPTDT